MKAPSDSTLRADWKSGMSLEQLANKYSTSEQLVYTNLKRLGLLDMTPGTCAHANEVPHSCPCVGPCYCKRPGGPCDTSW